MYTGRRKFGNISLVSICFILLFFALLVSGCSSSSSDTPTNYDTDSRILGEFATLEAYLGTVDGEAYPELDSDSLAGLISSAREAYTGGDLCNAAELISDFLGEAQGSRQGSSIPVAEDLFNRAWSLRYNMLIETAGGTECSGYERFGQEPAVIVLASDNESFQARIVFGTPRFVTTEAGDVPQTYSQIFVPGIPEWTVSEGLPDIPMFRRLIAVPRGSTATVTASATPGTAISLNLYPAQPPYPDIGEEGIQDPPFAKDESAYDQDALFPAELCTLNSVGSYRDMELVQLECAAAQYNPVSDELQLFDGVDFAVSFTGGTGKFITSMAQSPFEQTETVIPMLLNGDAVELYVEESEVSLLDTGEEFLIITTKDFKNAALDLAQWKSEKGLLTRVFDLDQIMDIMGTVSIDRDVIDAFIEDRYDSGMIRPTYVLLLGGYDQIPVYDRPIHSYYDDDNNHHEYEWSTDYGYADYKGSDLPFFALGRVRVTTPEQAQHYVDKVIRYESDPPLDPLFYQNVLEAGYFQATPFGYPCPDPSGTSEEQCGRTERWFIESSEFAREVLRNAGYTVDRAYVNDQTTTPAWYKDGSLLPAEIGYGSGFPWDAESDDVVAAINEGRFLVTHRDHGYSGGWGDPNFHTNDVLELENGELQPVVLSINCFSGHSTFVDRLLVQDRDDPAASTGGAVGVLAATRITYSGQNDALLRGLIDSIWPEALPYFGSPLSAPQRLGGMYFHAKLYVLGNYPLYYHNYSGEGVTVDPNTQATLWAHQTWGDPTLQMWTEAPEWAPPDYLVESSDTTSLTIDYGEIGAVVTAYQETEDGHYPLGRGSVVDGSTIISYIQEPLPNVPILLSASRANAVGLLLTPLMEISNDSLSFGSEGTELSLTISNTGGGTLDWSLADSLPAWLQLSATTSQLAAGESEVVTVTVDRTGLADGDYEHDLAFDTNVLNVESETLMVSVTMTVETSVPTFPLLKTGLTVSYDEDGNVATGLFDDGYYQQGYAFSYTANGDGTVTDEVTGLRWMQEGSATEVTYSAAQSYCSAVTLDGGGWRIPNVYEYYTILNFSQDNPALDHSFFSSISGYYWTATQMADSTLHVWSIREPYADDSIFTGVSGDNYVRCVKGTALEPPATGRFTDNGSGTVLDTWTGLVWEAASDHNGAAGHTWEEALSYCEAKTTLGREWHLPNVKQMQSLLSKDVAEPAIDTGFFTNDSYTLWTSSTDAYTNGGSMEFAWAASEGGYGDFVLAGVLKTSSTDDSSRPMGARCVSCSW